MSGRHPMSNRDKSDSGNDIGFAIIISLRSEKFFPLVLARSTLYPVLRRGDRPVAPTRFPDIGCFTNIRCLSEMNPVRVMTSYVLLSPGVVLLVPE